MELQILRGTKDTLPILKEGELGFCFDTQQLFIGTGYENVLMADAIALSRLVVSNSQLQASNMQLKRDIAELRSLIGSGSTGSGGSDATTLAGLTIDHFVLLDEGG